MSRVYLGTRPVAALAEGAGDGAEVGLLALALPAHALAAASAHRARRVAAQLQGLVAAEAGAAAPGAVVAGLALAASARGQLPVAAALRRQLARGDGPAAAVAGGLHADGEVLVEADGEDGDGAGGEVAAGDAQLGREGDWKTWKHSAKYQEPSKLTII